MIFLPTIYADFVDAFTFFGRFDETFRITFQITSNYLSYQFQKLKKNNLFSQKIALPN